ncbi:MAG: hypothetical protein P9X26_02990 [Candidatus Stygibacter frigidus]|nr:hypothetical protein [Candidatus Stygibacter frigidus]
MRKIVDIRNESGFGLISVLAMMLIVSIALLGLFISIEYAKYHVIENYHTRRALLLAQGYIEKVKYDNRNIGLTSYPHVTPLIENVTLDELKGDVLDCEVRVSTTAGGIPNLEPGYLNIYYDVVTVEVIWKENPIVGSAEHLNRERKVKIEEYYYWKRSGVIVQ